MLSATCHCRAIRVEIPSRPTELTNCNCSICRRLGTLWAYYDVDAVTVHGHPENTEEYIQGDKTLRVVRCRTCGCTTHWEPLNTQRDKRVGVNIRNFDPEIIGDVRIRLLDGADTWDSFFWEDLGRRAAVTPTPTATEVVREFWRLMASNDFHSVAAVLAADFVLEWPQSKERIRGAERFARMNQEFPAHGPWKFTLHRLFGNHTEVVSEVAVTDGVQSARPISFFTVVDGKISRLVEFWPEPYAAPQNRAHLVEPIE